MPGHKRRRAVYEKATALAHSYPWLSGYSLRDRVATPCPLMELLYSTSDPAWGREPITFSLGAVWQVPMSAVNHDRMTQQVCGGWLPGDKRPFCPRP